MTTLILIAIGGAVGALLRFTVTSYIYYRVDGTFPWGTFVVNISGCLVIGVLWQMVENLSLPHHFRSFLFIGVLGAYTTFSAYGLETFNLLRENELGYVLLNVLGSNIIGIAMLVLGYTATRYLFAIMK